MKFGIIIFIIFMTSIPGMGAPIQKIINHFKLAEQYQKNKEYDKAIEHFELAVLEKRSKKSKSKIYFLMGTAYYDQAEWDKAIKYYKKSFYLSKLYAQQCQYFMGLCYYAKRRKAEAQKAFQRSVDINRHPALTVSSKSYLHRIEKVKEKHWSLLTSLGYTYDNNLTTETSTGLINDDIVSDELSSQSNFIIGPSYFVAVGESSLLTAKSNTSGTFNLDRYQREYDSLEQSISLSLKTPWELGKRDFKTTFKTEGFISFHGTRDSISHRWYKMNEKHAGININTTYSPYSWMSWSFPVNFAYYDVVSKNGLNKDNDRDGPLYEIGLTDTLFIFGDPKISFKNGYRFTLNDARGKNKYFTNHKLLYGITYPLPLGFGFSFNGSVSRRDFPGNASSRKDWKYSHTYALNNNIGNYGIDFNITDIKNDSNLMRNDYRKQMFSFTVSRTF